jgi:hypothetical protein
MSAKIAAYVRDTHYIGGVKHARGELLPGWPCCCTGERVLRIMRSAAPLSWTASEVTCKGCLRVMAKDLTRPNEKGR